MGRHVRTIHQGALPLNALRSATTSFTGVTGRKAFCAILAGITTPIFPNWQRINFTLLRISLKITDYVLYFNSFSKLSYS